MGRACSTHWTNEKHIQQFAGKVGGKSPLGKHRRRWEDNITILILKT